MSLSEEFSKILVVKNQKWEMIRADKEKYKAEQKAIERKKIEQENIRLNSIEIKKKKALMQKLEDFFKKEGYELAYRGRVMIKERDNEPYTAIPDNLIRILIQVNKFYEYRRNRLFHDDEWYDLRFTDKGYELTKYKKSSDGWGDTCLRADRTYYVYWNSDFSETTMPWNIFPDIETILKKYK